MKEREGRGNSRLKWKKRDGDYSHGLSSGQVEALAAICDAMMPPLPLDTKKKDVKKIINENQAVESFLQSDGSHVNPQEVAELLVTKSIPRAVKVVRIVLRILSFRLGTLLLCGYLCLDWHWPFILKFSQISLGKREDILKRWNRNRLMAAVRTAFMIIKFFFFFYVFTWTDESSNNPTWEAIKYDLKECQENQIKGQGERPLQKGIIEMENEDDESLKQSLTQHGLESTKDPKDTNNYTIICDAVIVGSGCGGSVAAANLARSGLKVVVIEKGNYFVAEDYSSLEGPSLLELYESSGLLTTQDRMVMILAGKTVGGGSVVNWAASIRTPSPILKIWAVDHGILMFASQDYQLAMDRVCKRINVTEKVLKEGPQNQILRKGCENLGMEVKRVAVNSSEKHYSGSCSYGCRTADKQGADKTWLVDAVNCESVILAQTNAEKLILVDNDGEQGRESWRRRRCLGVVASYMHNKMKKKLRVEAEVTVLACGSLLTPPLMVSSGLKNHNIGRNLHLHPSLLAWGYFPEELSEFEGKTYEGELITSMHNMVEEDSHIPKATLEAPALGPGQFAALFPWVSGTDIKERMIKYGRTSNLFVFVRDNGSGEVMKQTQIKYQLSPSDKKNITMALRQALRILVAAGAVEVGTYRNDGQRIICKGVEEEDLEEFLHTVGASGAMSSLTKHCDIYLSYHQMGSCRMGATEEEGAVDENGESWEAKDLYVCDASVLPTAVGVNPMITIQATAYCISHKIAELMKRKNNKTKNHV